MVGIFDMRNPWIFASQSYLGRKAYNLELELDPHWTTTSDLQHHCYDKTANSVENETGCIREDEISIHNSSHRRSKADHSDNKVLTTSTHNN